MKIGKKKNLVIKMLKEKEEKLLDIVDSIIESLDTLDDPELSEMGETFREGVIDFLEENDLMTLNEIRQFVESIEES